MLDNRVLVLNQNYEPTTVCSARKAIKLIFLQKAEMVEHDTRYVRSPSISFPLPSIVRLDRYVHMHRKTVLLTRKNILRRDRHTCQYCGRKHMTMTVDHVIPKKRGGRDTWENLVCACNECNARKGNRTPHEADMELLSTPRKPGYLSHIQHLAGNPDNRWKPYLYMS
ncbi:HNH endonuclease [bacterium]|nr:HNH endonuclease [bacterium]